MSDFALRGLEIHSSRLWQMAQIDRTLDFMTGTGLNALIFHQNDIIDELVLPSQYFDEAQMLARWPIRFARLWDNRIYMNQVVRKAGERGIRVFFQTKEIWYPEPLLETHPELRNPDGSICPTNPFWWQFVSDKMRDVITHVPGFSGVIVSPGTRESRVSISTNACTCERCRGTDPATWYRDLLAAMHEPLAESGKTLAVRDFSWTAEQQSQIVDGASLVSREIVIQLKNTPHDFYPTFPDNPRIGQCDDHPQWLEYDTWGQFYGLGIFPVSVADDIKARLTHAKEKGVSGVIFRTDWEIILDQSVFNSCNLVNLVAGAMLANETDTPLDTIYRAWLDIGVMTPYLSGSYLQQPIKPKAPDAHLRWAAYFSQAWKVIEKGIYARGHVFHENSMFPDTAEKPYFYMIDFPGRDDWEPGASALVIPTDENLPLLLEEKREAVALVKSLPSTLDVSTMGLPEGTVRDLQDMLALFELYIRTFKTIAEAVFLVYRARNGLDASAASKALRILPELTALRDEVADVLASREHPHLVLEMMDPQRLTDLISDIRSCCA
jgi:hypothetical protein